jgi:radical SAM protein with 4Fe4S-binding SPASM domain
MQPNIIQEYEQTRNVAETSFRSACYAPYTSLYFDVRGNVRVCCHNFRNKVGNITEQSLDEIWNGARIKSIREALLAYDFSQGCEFCEWQLSSRSYASLATRKWDSLAPGSLGPSWPQMMEFSINTTCNLECVMCDGDHSSSIRARREKRSPLSNPYGEDFFEQLRRYLPHLRRTKFLGGEPFLQDGCYRIWEMMMEENTGTSCHVTTNGTVFNVRVERAIEALPFSISISVDGFTKETVERVRVNAQYERVMENVHRFRAYTRARKTSFGLTFCMMRYNWFEFGDFCLFADSLQCSVGINLVRNPPELSLFTLPKSDLEAIVSKMERQAENLLPRLGRNRDIWLGELTRLRQHALGAVEIPNLVKIKSA